MWQSKAKAILLAVSLMVLSFSTLAATAYKYLNADGSVGYGDVLPEDALLLEVLEVADSENTDSLADSNALIEQLAATADRLKEDRQDRDAARLEAEKARAEARYQSQPPVVYREESDDPYYLNRPYRPHIHRPYRPHRPHRTRSTLRPFPDIHRQPDERSSISPRRYNGPILAPRSSLLTP